MTTAHDLKSLTIATTNEHKVREIREMLEPMGIEVVGLADLDGDFPEPVEDGDTFADNARLKAVGYAKLIGTPCLADDSGLCVDALNGAPGVHSARYAGVDGDRATRDAANNAKLLAELEGVPGGDDRAARFMCAMCVAAPDGTVIAESLGAFEGTIAHEPKGSNGFGYDPLLRLDDGRHAAELSADEKHALSHRGKALRAMLLALKG